MYRSEYRRLWVQESNEFEVRGVVAKAVWWRIWIWRWRIRVGRRWKWETIL